MRWSQVFSAKPSTTKDTKVHERNLNLLGLVDSWYRCTHADKSVRATLSRSASARGQPVLQKRYALHARNLEALAAADVLADHHVVAAQHVRLRFGEFRAIAIIGSRRENLFFHCPPPFDF